MAEHIFIRSNDFNKVFKNYLRDFYVYQFKEKGDFFTKKDKKIPNGTYYNYINKLKNALNNEAGMMWNNEKKGSQRNVKYITADTRTLNRNPFFDLYGLCAEKSTNAGNEYALLFTLLFYFQLGKKICRPDYNPLSDDDLQKLRKILKYKTVDIIDAENGSHSSTWESFLNLKNKDKYISKVIARFYDGGYNDELGLKKIYKHILKYNERVVFKNDDFHVCYIDLNEMDRAYLNNALNEYNLQIGIKQFYKKLKSYARAGILVENNSSYSMSKRYIKDLFENKDKDFFKRFCLFVSFFSEITVLGEIGNFILDRLEYKPDDTFLYKHHYLKNTLNDYNNIDILHAIKKGYWMYIEYRNPSPLNMEYQRMLCYPIELRENVKDGRQFLIYYTPKYRSISALRVEFIDFIKLGTYHKSEDFENDIEHAKNLIKYTWGTSFTRNFKEGNVKKEPELKTINIAIHYSKEEGYIKNHILKQTKNILSHKESELGNYGYCMEIQARLVDPFEMIPWFMSYTERILKIEIDGKPFTDYNNRILKLLELYKNNHKNSESDSVSSPDHFIKFNDGIPLEFEEVDTLHNLLFDDLFSVQYQKLNQALTKAMTGSYDIDELENEYADSFRSNTFTDKDNKEIWDERKKQIEAIFFILTFHNKSIFNFKDIGTKLIDILPLSNIEQQWLLNILDHSLAGYFLEPDEINCIKNSLDDMDLFDINNVIYHDQHMNNFKLKSDCLEKILHANINHKMIEITYTGSNAKSKTYCIAPVYIEYDKRSSKFRLLAIDDKSKIYRFSLIRIHNVSINEQQPFDMDSCRKEVMKHLQEKKSITVQFADQKGVVDRLLTEFSCFKKECWKWKNKNEYQMKLYYLDEEKNDIVLRLLSYYPYITVTEDDDGFISNEIRKRAEKQITIFRTQLYNTTSLGKITEIEKEH